VKLIYVAGPYTAPTRDGIEENIRKAEEVGKSVLLAGHVPVIPHKITGHWDACAKFKGWAYDHWMDKFCFPLLRACDGILMMPDWNTSPGAMREREFAFMTGIPIYYLVSEIV